MSQDADFDFTDQGVVAAYVLLLNQTQLAELFQMVLGYAGAAVVECSLDFADANWVTVLEKVPVDFPCLAA